MPIFTLDPGAMPDDYGEDLLPLDEIKKHLRVDVSDEDDLIGYYRDAAIDLVERVAEVAIGPRPACIAKGVRIGSDGSACLGLWPIRTLVSVTGYDGSGEAVAIPIEDIDINRDCITLLRGRRWPSGIGGLVNVIFNAGCETPDEARMRFGSLIHAARLMTAHIYANREAGEGDVPAGVAALVQPYRIIRI